MLVAGLVALALTSLAGRRRYLFTFASSTCSTCSFHHSLLQFAFRENALQDLQRQTVARRRRCRRRASRFACRVLALRCLLVSPLLFLNAPVRLSYRQPQTNIAKRCTLRLLRQSLPK